MLASLRSFATSFVSFLARLVGIAARLVAFPARHSYYYIRYASNLFLGGADEVGDEQHIGHKRQQL